MIATFTLNGIKRFKMMRLLVVLLVLGVGVNSTFAQSQPAEETSKVVVEKGTLQGVSARSTATKPTTNTAEKVAKSETVETKHVRPVIEMTDEYIDHQISEIQKVIDKSKDDPKFNLSGYQKRIKYLESRRPKK